MSPSFADLGVPSDLCALLERRGISAPFPIQVATLPDALAGKDVCGMAPTGSGKTLAFGIAAVMQVGHTGPKRPHGLILAPTRELAAQIRDEIAPLAKARGRTVAAFYGGAGFETQLKALRRGVDIVVACPGRLEDLMARGVVRLDAIRFVAVDEADRMADMGFLPAVRRILATTPGTRQTVLFSATLDKAVDVLVRDAQRQPTRHDVTPPEEDSADVDHHFWHADRARRVELTAGLVARHHRVIVFCRTKHGADRVAHQLTRSGVDAVAIHGNRSQGQRERALASFADGRAQALVATDVAARGIHVDAVPCVVHFDLPADPKDYLHRSGRTGRAGLSGTVVSLVAPDQKALARDVQRSLGLPDRIDQAEELAPPAARTHPKPDRAGDAGTRSLSSGPHGRARGASGRARPGKPGKSGNRRGPKASSGSQGRPGGGRSSGARSAGAGAGRGGRSGRRPSR